MKAIKGFRFQTADGFNGMVSEIIFDAQQWMVRYASAALPGVDTCGLIAAVAFANFCWNDRIIICSLPFEELRSSPGTKCGTHISLAYLQHLHRHFGWPLYWEEAVDVDVNGALHGSSNQNSPEKQQNEGDLPFWTLETAVSCRIKALDGEVGTVEDLLFDDENWAIKYLVVDQRRPGAENPVLIPAVDIMRFSGAEKVIQLGIAGDACKSALPFEALSACELG